MDYDTKTSLYPNISQLQSQSIYAPSILQQTEPNISALNSQNSTKNLDSEFERLSQKRLKEDVVLLKQLLALTQRNQKLEGENSDLKSEIAKLEEKKILKDKERQLRKQKLIEENQEKERQKQLKIQQEQQQQQQQQSAQSQAPTSTEKKDTQPTADKPAVSEQPAQQTTQQPPTNTQAKPFTFTAAPKQQDQPASLQTLQTQFSNVQIQDTKPGLGFFSQSGGQGQQGFGQTSQINSGTMAFMQPSSSNRFSGIFQ